MSGNMIPSVLIQNSVVNENQDSVLNTVRLTPNSFSNNTVVFVVPKSGSVLNFFTYAFQLIAKSSRVNRLINSFCWI